MKPEKPLNVKKVISRFYKSEAEKNKLRIQLNQLVLSRFDIEMNYKPVPALNNKVTKEVYLEKLNQRILETKEEYDNVLKEHEENVKLFDLVKNITNLKHYESSEVRQLKSKIQKLRNFLSSEEREQIKLKNFLKSCSNQNDAFYCYDDVLFLYKNENDIKKAKLLIKSSKNLIQKNIERLKKLRDELKQAYMNQNQ